MKYRIKVVPKAAPNSEGRWLITTEVPPCLASKWRDIAAHFTVFVPEGHFMVNYEEAKPTC